MCFGVIPRGSLGSLEGLELTMKLREWSSERKGERSFLWLLKGIQCTFTFNIVAFEYGADFASL